MAYEDEDDFDTGNEQPEGPEEDGDDQANQGAQEDGILDRLPIQLKRGKEEGDGQGIVIPNTPAIMCPKCREKGKLIPEGIMSSIIGLAGFAACTCGGKIRLPRIYCAKCKKWYKVDEGPPLKEDIVYNFALDNIIPRDKLDK